MSIGIQVRTEKSSFSIHLKINLTAKKNQSVQKKVFIFNDTYL